MDELKIRTKFMRGMLSKALELIIRKKTGYNVKIQLNAIDVQVTEGRANFRFDINGDLSTEEFKKLSRLIGLED